MMKDRVEFNHEEYRNKMEEKVKWLEEQLAKKQNEIDRLKEPISNISIDYKAEYYRLKKLETENEELKETLLNVCKIVFKCM